MATPDVARQALKSAPMPARPRWLHWLAWFAAVVSFVILAVPVMGGRSDLLSNTLLGQVDLAICVLFAAEFFTRSGFRQDGWNYAKWRGFDVLAMVPVLFIAGYTGLQAWFLWFVLLARLVRLVDRTLGDGFVKRNVLAIIEGIEEEISDRVILKIMTRVEAELASANFGTTAAAAITKNKEAILHKIYAEQLPETGALSRVANITGLQAAVEKMEARIFDAIINVIGSGEMDNMIRDIVSQSMTRIKAEVGQRTWRSKLGFARPQTVS